MRTPAASPATPPPFTPEASRRWHRVPSPHPKNVQSMGIPHDAQPPRRTSPVTPWTATDTQVANSALTHDGQFTDNELSSHS